MVHTVSQVLCRQKAYICICTATESVTIICLHPYSDIEPQAAEIPSLESISFCLKDGKESSAAQELKVQNKELL